MNQVKRYITVACLIFAHSVKSQEMKKEDLVGKWRLNWQDSGFFPNDDLLFEPTTDPPSQYIFEFKKDGNWNYENDLLTVELRDLKIADYWYWWKVSYTVETQGDKLFLKVYEAVKNRKIDSKKTWEELIRE